MPDCVIMLRVSFLPSLSVSWLIAGIEFSDPPVPPDPRYLFVVCLFYTRLNKRLSRECVYWKAIITTQRYLGPSTCYRTVIYDIGTKILFLQYNGHNSTHIAPPELAFSVNYTKFSVDSESAVKITFQNHDVLKKGSYLLFLKCWLVFQVFSC